MPYYEFFCDDCRDVFEERRKMSESDDPAPCPTCGRHARRVISLVCAATFDNRPPPSIVPTGVSLGPPTPTILNRRGGRILRSARPPTRLTLLIP